MPSPRLRRASKTASSPPPDEGALPARRSAPQERFSRRAPRNPLRPEPPELPAPALRVGLLVADPGLSIGSELSFGLGNAFSYVIDVFQVRSSQPSVSPERPRWPSPASCAHLYPPSARNTAPPRPPPTSDAYRSTQSRSAATSECSAAELQMAVDAPPWHMIPPWHMSGHCGSMLYDVT